MNQNFTLEIKRKGEYVSPSIDQTSVDTEKVFCMSNVTHDAFGELYELEESAN